MFQINTFDDDVFSVEEDVNSNYLSSILDDRAIALQEELALEDSSFSNEEVLSSEFDSMFDGIEI